MPPTSTMPSVLQVGTSAVGAPSPGRHAATLTNLPGCPDLPGAEDDDMLRRDILCICPIKAAPQSAECRNQVSLQIHGRALIMLGYIAQAAGLQAHLKKLWYSPNACQSAALLQPVMVTVNMLTFSLPPETFCF